MCRFCLCLSSKKLDQTISINSQTPQLKKRRGVTQGQDALTIRQPCCRDDRFRLKVGQIDTKLNKSRIF